ncbi:MAG: multicopper oxidase family protein [Pseudomonadota bacterium]
MVSKLSRRAVLGGGIAAAAVAPFAGRVGAADAEVLDLKSRETAFDFGGGLTRGVVSTLDGAPPPVIRLKRNQEARITLENGLPDYTTMHWHGIRLPNAMDGVPYLTQLPLLEGDRFEYRFASPDAGTFWYHPHCMTMRQMAQGLTGILIVEEDEDPGFDLDLPLNLKDFRLGNDAELIDYWTPRGAARGGTLGNVMTTNWQRAPRYDAPAGGLVRLRLAATDTTRIYRLALPEGSAGRIIAWDGHPVEEEVPWPTTDAPLFIGPGQRVDIALLMPAFEGAEISLLGMHGLEPMTFATLRAVGRSLGRDARDIPRLPPNPVPEPDLANVELREIGFGWAPDDLIPDNGLCGSLGYTFWSINRDPWPGDAVEGTAAVATLELGKTYVLRMRNESPNTHPIHLHGLVFKPIRSNQGPVPANWTDTILLRKNEIVDAVLVADNPGDWAFHCHIIEHQKTGLSGYIRVV